VFGLVVVIGLPMGGAGHPLIAHLVGASALEMLFGGSLGFRLSGVHRWNAARIGLGGKAKG
jgi:hypothetical protein